jgi:NTP pyrophosphatase (non-canonical NTP hydrolase)
MEKIFELIKEERKRQDKKWGVGYQQSAGTWLAILMEEVGEVAKAVLTGDWDNGKKELIQVAAVCVAWLEKLYGI